jgi:hypothetical protein
VSWQTDLSQSHYRFKSHMKSSLQRLIPFLPFSNCQLDSIHLLPSSYPGRLASRTQLFLTELFFITTLHGPCRKHNLSIVTKARLQRRSTAMEVTLLLLAYSLPWEYLKGRLAMNVYSEFTLPAFGRHVTILTYVYKHLYRHVYDPKRGP